MKLFFLILLNTFFVINSFTQDIKEVITTTHSKKIEKSFDLGNGKKFSNLYFEGTLSFASLAKMCGMAHFTFTDLPDYPLTSLRFPFRKIGNRSLFP